mmetsp:Transcript_113804/g.332442  ORF Transcript_113804/g.332442 Transcript_113804/m.332442 type:complete len:376 (+) Transcript_113804:346-1473(+)
MLVHEHVGATRLPMCGVAWNGPLNHNDGLWHVVLINPVDDLEDLGVSLNGVPVAHPAGHPLARQHAARRSARAHGTVAAVVLGTVAHGPALVAPPPDGALEALALGSAVDVDEVSLGEDVRRPNLLADLPLLPVLRPQLELLELLQRRQVSRLEVLDPGLARAFQLPVLGYVAVIAHLYCIVAVPLRPLLAGDKVAAALDDKDGGTDSFGVLSFIKDGGHVQLLGPNPNTRLCPWVRHPIPPRNCLVWGCRHQVCPASSEASPPPLGGRPGQARGPHERRHGAGQGPGAGARRGGRGGPGSMGTISWERERQLPGNQRRPWLSHIPGSAVGSRLERQPQVDCTQGEHRQQGAERHHCFSGHPRLKGGTKSPEPRA